MIREFVVIPHAKTTTSKEVLIMKRLKQIGILIILLITISIVAPTSFAGTYFQTTKTLVPIWSAPSSNSTLVYRIEKIGTLVNVVESKLNSAGNLWHKLSNGRYVFSGNVTKSVSTLSISPLPSITYFSGGRPAESFNASVTSNYPIKNVEIQISTWGICSIPNVLSYNISPLFTNFKFETLAPGTYNYTVKASDPIKSVLKVGSFKVLPQKFELSGLENLTGFNTQDDFPDKSPERSACASFALAQCMLILGNEKYTTPQNLWEAGSNLVVWGRGNYTATKAYHYKTEQEVLLKALNELLRNRPSIIQVKGSTEEHWITVVGFVGVKSKNNLTTSNFIIIDPYNGRKSILSSEFSLHSERRIAYSNN